MKLDQRFVSLVSRRSKGCSSHGCHRDCAAECLVSNTYIQDLKQYISCGQGGKLSAHEIDQRVSHLIGDVYITFDFPYEKREFLRAQCNVPRDELVVERLSYFSTSDPCQPGIGRFNKAGDGLFYATVINSPSGTDDALQTTLQEIRAKDEDEISVLRSSQVDGVDLNLRIIGYGSWVREGKKPGWMQDNVFDYLKMHYNYLDSKLCDNLRKASQNVDDFMASIIAEPESKKLYDVTSSIGRVLMESSSIDGIVYSSTRAADYPVIVLKPNSVDDKIQYDEITVIKIHQKPHQKNFEWW
ncbi:hypothetical protein [Endozoicomonas sp.]|uniref:hypothetical protein n=1 Tax=Endozoicomonas sp. TaxID=1892382 RepID=UPI003AF5C4E0